MVNFATKFRKPAKNARIKINLCAILAGIAVVIDCPEAESRVGDVIQPPAEDPNVPDNVMEA